MIVRYRYPWQVFGALLAFSAAGLFRFSCGGTTPLKFRLFNHLIGRFQSVVRHLNAILDGQSPKSLPDADSFLHLDYLSSIKVVGGAEGLGGTFKKSLFMICPQLILDTRILKEPLEEA